MVKLSEQEIIRRRKLEEIRKLGINPYPAANFISIFMQKISRNYIKMVKWSSLPGV